jgi:hypothetical protein
MLENNDAARLAFSPRKLAAPSREIQLASASRRLLEKYAVGAPLSQDSHIANIQVIEPRDANGRITLQRGLGDVRNQTAPYSSSWANIRG